MRGSSEGDDNRAGFEALRRSTGCRASRAALDGETAPDPNRKGGMKDLSAAHSSPSIPRSRTRPATVNPALVLFCSQTLHGSENRGGIILEAPNTLENCGCHDRHWSPTSDASLKLGEADTSSREPTSQEEIAGDATNVQAGDGDVGQHSRRTTVDAMCVQGSGWESITPRGMTSSLASGQSGSSSDAASIFRSVVATLTHHGPTRLRTAPRRCPGWL